MDIHAALLSQYAAALRMMRRTIENCPDDLWNDPAFGNRFWHIVYHTLFYTHLYLSPSEAEFRPWERMRESYHFFSAEPEPQGGFPREFEPYRRAELLEYQVLLEQSLEALVQAVPLDAGSGFSWLPFNRMEVHIYNLRHMQHHIGQLIERLRATTGSGVGWVGMGR